MNVIDWLLDSDPAIRWQMPVDLGEREDEPSPWITLHALRVLRWANQPQETPAPTAASA